MMHVETFLAILSAAVLLALAVLALIARLNGPEDDDDDGEQTPIIEAPADEPLGDQVDIKGLMLRQSELLGAAVAVLSSIHKAGGWHVLDPSHQDHMRASLDALEAAVEAMLNKRSSQHGQVE